MSLASACQKLLTPEHLSNPQSLMKKKKVAKPGPVTTSCAGDFYPQDVRKGKALFLISSYENWVFFLPLSTSSSLVVSFTVPKQHQSNSFLMCQNVKQSQANFLMILPLLFCSLLLGLFHSELPLYHTTIMYQ